MNIKNIRLGFACNSSSTHSLVSGVPAHEMETAHDPQELGTFGWNNFCLATKESKMAYLAVFVADAFQKVGLNDEYTKAIIQELLGVDWDPGWCVDHDSHIGLPSDQYGNPHIGFLRHFSEWLSRDDVVVAGGNDNDNSSGYIGPGKRINLPIEGDCYFNPDLMVREEGNGFWTIFNPKNGSRVTFDFDNSEWDGTSSVPMLVDMKITDYCPYECDFCYQGSDKAGTHAAKREVLQAIGAMGELGVMEIALGGGEPTLWPEFLDLFCGYGVALLPKLSFTTRNTGFLRANYKKLVGAKNLGAVAVSVDTPEDMEKLIELKKELPKLRLHAQIIEKVPTREQLKQMITMLADSTLLSRPPLTLLGYKTTERGAEVTPNEYSWVDVIRELDNEKVSFWDIRFSVDTAIIQGYEKELGDLFPRWATFATKEEGRVSMYLDLVKKRMAKSSYVGDEEYIPITKKKDVGWMTNLTDYIGEIQEHFPFN